MREKPGTGAADPPISFLVPVHMNKLYMEAVSWNLIKSDSQELYLTDAQSHGFSATPRERQQQEGPQLVRGVSHYVWLHDNHNLRAQHLTHVCSRILGRVI